MGTTSEKHWRGKLYNFEAIEKWFPSGRGGLLISASAGTGKTTFLVEVLIYSFMRSLEEGGVAGGKEFLERSLVLTFTHKAAGEVRERFRRRVGEFLSEDLRKEFKYRSVRSQTFHSFAYSFVNQHFDALHLPPFSSVVGETEEKELFLEFLLKSMEEGELGEYEFFKKVGASPRSFFVRGYETHKRVYGFLKLGVPVMVDDRDPVLGEEYLRMVNSCFSGFSKFLRERSLLTFDELMMALVESKERVWETLKKDYDLLLVDEFQDTDFFQFEIVRDFVKAALKGEKGAVLVGDVKQSIYQWRSALPGLFSSLKEVFGEKGRVYHLRKHFRMGKSLAEKVNAVFKNAGFYESEEDVLIPVKRFKTEGTVAVYDERKECLERLAFHLADRIRRGEDPSKIVLLVRKKTDIESLKEALERAGVDFVVHGDASFWEREEVRLLLNSAFSLLPYSGKYYRFVSQLENLVLHSDGDREIPVSAPFFGAYSCIESALTPRERENARRVCFLTLNLERSGFNSLDYLFLRHVSGGRVLKLKEPEVPVEEKGKVEVLTVHAMKGLERDRVYVVDLAEFFSTRAPTYPLLSVEVGRDGVERVSVQLRKGRRRAYEEAVAKEKTERMRLLYVAFTRAKRGLHVFAHLGRRASKESKRFIQEVLLTLSGEERGLEELPVPVEHRTRLEQFTPAPVVLASAKAKKVDFLTHWAEREGTAFHELVRVPHSCYYALAYPHVLPLARKVRKALNEMLGGGEFELWLCDPDEGEFFRVDLYYPENNVIVEFKHAVFLKGDYREQVRNYARLLEEIVGETPRAYLVIAKGENFDVIEVSL